jgi:flagellar motility protein MotE (MotC chaperone)
MNVTSRTARGIGIRWAVFISAAGFLAAASAPVKELSAEPVMPVAASGVVAGAAIGGGGSLAERYCANIADHARDARFVWQSKQLRELTEALKEQVKFVESKSQELKGWVERRDQFLKLGNDSLINIYSSMRPDAASQQLLNLPEAVAAAVIMKLEPRLSSSILNEMDPVRAGRLATVIAGIGRVSKPDGGT